MANLTVSAVLAQVDALLPNGYTNEEKCRWVTQAEGFVRAEVYGLDPSTMGQLGEEDTLCAPAPHQELYRHYVEAQIHYANGEMTRYNNAAAMWNNALMTLRDFVCRTSPPREGVKSLHFA